METDGNSEKEAASEIIFTETQSAFAAFMP
jgi:hypothetical protein